jgi:hypothetical protein
MAKKPSVAAVREVVLDLTTSEDEYRAIAYQPERVIHWLRTSGGSLGERRMKAAAAELLEAQYATTETPPVLA